MAEERQQARSPQSQGQQPSAQIPQQQTPRRGNGQQSGMMRRGGHLPSMFHMDPFEMFRTSPFSMMRRFMEDMDHYAAQFGMGRGGQGMAAAGSQAFSPTMEIFERDGQFIVRADLPGLTKEDLHVEVTEDVLTIAGERRSEHESQQGGMFRSERSYGTFHRQIPLPQGVNTEQVTAQFQNGVLEVSMPMPSQQVRGRQIDIQSGTSTQGGPSNGMGQPASSSMSQEPATAKV